MSCTSNLKQIGLGAMQYSQDYDETYVRSWRGPDSNASDVTQRTKWMDILQPYTKSEQIFNCPSDSHQINRPYKFRDGINYGSYALNSAYFVEFATRRSPDAVAEAAIEDVSGTVWITETVNSNASYTFGWAGIANNPIPTPGPPRQLERIVERHFETANVLWCDGHVKAVKLDKLLAKNAEGTLTALTVQMD